MESQFRQTEEPLWIPGLFLLASGVRLKGQPNFELLLLSISARFVYLPACRIDGEVEDSQRRICEYQDLDRATLWQVDAGEPGMLLLTHFHQISGIQRPAKRMKARNFFSWVSRKVLGGEMVIISKMTDLPPETDRDRESFRLYDARSDVLVPLSVGEGLVFGLLSFAVMTTTAPV